MSSVLQVSFNLFLQVDVLQAAADLLSSVFVIPAFNRKPTSLTTHNVHTYYIGSFAVTVTHLGSKVTRGVGLASYHTIV